MLKLLSIFALSMAVHASQPCYGGVHDSRGFWEQATIWVNRNQGLDPFDKNIWCREKVYTDSLGLTKVADISRTSVIELPSKLPSGSEIPLILDCESWNVYFTPDERYGKEQRYQAFQLHKHHRFSWKGKPND